MSEPVLLVHDVRKRFGRLTAVDGVSLQVQEGEVVVILGRSGSGKSTLIRCVHQLEEIEQGSIYLDGELLGYGTDGRGQLRRLSEREIARQRTRIGMVFQQFNLFSHRTVLENVSEAPMRVKGESRRDAERRARELLDRIGLADKPAAYPNQLSGGQQQRVAIARALAMRPRLLLFDEPTSSLDPELVGEVLEVMRDLAAEGMTMVVVTHELGFARDVADRCVFMADGRIVEEGAVPQVLDAPRSPSFRRFLAVGARELDGAAAAPSPSPGTAG